jgi:hypothetical protein
MRRKGALPELLAPAGSFECLVAAVAAGADAVYVGGRRFGARAFAKNFDLEELALAVKYCHLHGVKLYVTVNTLVFDRDAREMRVSVNFGEFTTSALPAELVNAPYEGTGMLVLGQDTTGHYAHGSMICVVDDFMVFDRALTQSDLAELSAQ